MATKNNRATIFGFSAFRRSLVFLASAALAAFFAAAQPAAAQAAPAAPVKNVILVHGAWADGSCWSKVIPMLQAKGLHVTAVQIPLTSLADDVATTQRAIALEDGPVILVGHSYGGVVITEAGNDPKVVGLVFIAAFAPDAGENGLGITKPYPPAPLAADLRPDSQGFLKITPEGFANDFAQDLPPAQIKILTAAQHPTNIAALTGNVTTASWKTKPTWFAISANDRAIPTQLEKDEAARMKSVTVTLASSHLSMLAKPAEVSALIVKATAGSK
ncbi:MAG TPA: alpha/beta hydrolase [Candidatus Acidoferrales bacterium]